MTAISAAPGGFRTGWVTVMNHEDAHVQVTAEAVDTVMDADGVLSPAAMRIEVGDSGAEERLIGEGAPPHGCALLIGSIRIF